MYQKLARIQISYQELLRKMLIFSTDFLHFRVNNLSYQSKFPSVFKLQISLLSLKMVREILRKIIDQSAYF